jgi:hypothetical protein
LWLRIVRCRTGHAQFTDRCASDDCSDFCAHCSLLFTESAAFAVDRCAKESLLRWCTGQSGGTPDSPVNYSGALSAFRPRGSLDRRVNCRRVPQPRWVGARRSAKGGRSWRETGVKGETRGLRVCPAPRSGALAVGGYKRPHGREREAYASAVPSFPARPTLCKRALDLPFICVRRGSRCTMGGVAVC